MSDPDPATSENTKKEDQAGIGCVLTILFVLGVLGWGYTEWRLDAFHRQPWFDGRRQAKNACEARVLQEVSSPSTVVFESSVGATTKDVSVKGPMTPEDGEPQPQKRRYYMVESYFDAQNSAGAITRSRYSCFAQWIERTGIWNVGVTTSSWNPQ